MAYEYKVVPAPVRGEKVRGVKSAADRFARTLTNVMNEMAAEGWDYLRTDTLPAEERSGLTGKTTVFQNMLVFRRAAKTQEAQATAAVATEVEAAVEATPEAAPEATPVPEHAPVRVRDIAETHAPKLPSARGAQEVSEGKAPVFSSDRRGGDARQ